MNRTFYIGWIHIALFLAAVSFHADAWAAGVFKCTGADGEVTFAFAPCGKPEQASTTQTVEPVIKAPRGRQLADLEIEIKRLEAAIDDARRTHRTLLQQRLRPANELTAEFDAETATLLAELAKLQQERTRVQERRDS